MTPETMKILNSIDAQADRLVEISMEIRGEDQAGADVLQTYAESLMSMSAQTWTELRRLGKQ